MIFHELKEHVTQVLMTKHFHRDAKDFDMHQILEHEEYTKLHKFEETVHGIHIFRALINKVHYVFAIDDNRLIMLRAFHNFKEYKKFLENKKDIVRMVESI